MLEIDATELNRFVKCNGSRLMAASFVTDDDTNNSGRAEGVAAHYMAAMVYSGRVSSLSELVDRKAPNGTYMTDDMAEYVSTYLDAIGSEGDIEQATTFEAPNVYRVTGRADFVALRGDVLNVYGFHYGWRIVEPEHNWTLIVNAISYIRQTGAAPSTINLIIHQPRPYHPDSMTRTWPISYDALLQYMQQLHMALVNPSDELHTGAHCRDCKAVATCPAARLAEMNAIDAATMAFTDTISNEVLSHTLDVLNKAEQMIKVRKDAFDELAKHRLKSGQIIENYSLELSQGNRRFRPGIDGAMLRVLTGLDLTTEKLLTPSAAERKGANKDVIAAMTERPSTGTKLVRISASKKAERLFKHGK